MPLAKQVVLPPLCNSQKRVLIVAQEIELRARIARLLQLAGHNVELAGSRTRALELAACKKISAAIIAHSSDLNDLGQEIREHIPQTLMLYPPTADSSRCGPPSGGAQAQVFDEQKLLDQLREPTALVGGADDGTNAEPVLIIGDYQLDVAAHAFVDGNGREVPLTRTEFTLLRVFTRNPRRVLSREQLRHAVGGRGAGTDDRSIDMLVARLRRKIESNPKAPRFIISVAGVGYKFAVRPQAAGPANTSHTVERLNQFPLGDDMLAQVPLAEREIPKFTVCVRLQGLEERIPVPFTPLMVRKLAFEACKRNQKTTELAAALVRMAAEKRLTEQILIR